MVHSLCTGCQTIIKSPERSKLGCHGGYVRNCNKLLRLSTKAVIYLCNSNNIQSYQLQAATYLKIYLTSEAIFFISTSPCNIVQVSYIFMYFYDF